MIIEFKPGRVHLAGHVDEYDAVGYDEELEEHGFYWNERAGCFYNHVAGVVWPDNPFDV